LRKYGAFAHHWRHTLKTRFFAQPLCASMDRDIAQVWALSTQHSEHPQTLITIGAMITIGDFARKTHLGAPNDDHPPTSDSEKRR
jgi:hypothetical protein